MAYTILSYFGSSSERLVRTVFVPFFVLIHCTNHVIAGQSVLTAVLPFYTYVETSSLSLMMHCTTPIQQSGFMMILFCAFVCTHIIEFRFRSSEVVNIFRNSTNGRALRDGFVFRGFSFSEKK